jgi:hypothetical protein
MLRHGIVEYDWGFDRDIVNHVRGSNLGRQESDAQFG